MERRVWATTQVGTLYPNIYAVLVGDAGIGKSVAINHAVKILRQVPEVHFAPTSMTSAALIDCMLESKVVDFTDPENSYNTLFLAADEFTAFMPTYSAELIATLTVFYDCSYFGEARRKFGGELNQIPNPQMNILAGSTPSNLIRLLPDFAWEQGFTSRVMMIYSAEKPERDLFGERDTKTADDLVNDLQIIRSLNGQFDRTDEYKNAVNEWRQSKSNRGPKHPKLEHYCTRRVAHLIKLSMVASLATSDDLILKLGDFQTAMKWMLEAELAMPKMFDASTVSPDSRAMDEVYHFVQSFGAKGVSSYQVINMIRRKIAYGSQALVMLNVMEQSGMLIIAGVDKKTGVKHYKAKDH